MAVQPGLAPGYLYTNPRGSGRHPLLLAGLVDLDLDEASKLLNALDLSYSAVERAPSSLTHEGERFFVNAVHASWAEHLLARLGPGEHQVAHYLTREGDRLRTVARCHEPFPAGPSSAWYFAGQGSWSLPIPSPSWMACTMGVLCGETPTFVTRWDEDYWEVLDRPSTEVDKANVRIVPIACALDLGLDLISLADMPIMEPSG